LSGIVFVVSYGISRQVCNACFSGIQTLIFAGSSDIQAEPAKPGFGEIEHEQLVER
jgi:hypothetical protein